MNPQNSKMQNLDCKKALQAKGAKPLQYSVVSNKEGNHFNCSLQFNGKTFEASDAIKKESEQKVADGFCLN